MSTGDPLNIYYRVRGRAISITKKTGRLIESRTGDYKFLRQNVAHEEYYTASGCDMETDIGAKANDDVTMALFNDCSFFLLFNHRNSAFKYYPAAIHDLIWTLTDKNTGFVKDFLNSRALSREAKTFDKSRTFHEVLEAIRKIAI